jgi:hypothetical protein
MENEIKKINIKEFREKGYLQELNRRFLHPLGLAMEVNINEDGTESLGGVWDYREDDNGISYDIQNSEPSRIERFRSNKDFIEQELERRLKHRRMNIGFGFEPVDNEYHIRYNDI